MREHKKAGYWEGPQSPARRQAVLAGALNLYDTPNRYQKNTVTHDSDLQCS